MIHYYSPTQLFKWRINRNHKSRPAKPNNPTKAPTYTNFSEALSLIAAAVTAFVVGAELAEVDVLDALTDVEVETIAAVGVVPLREEVDVVALGEVEVVAGLAVEDVVSLVTGLAVDELVVAFTDTELVLAFEDKGLVVVLIKDEGVVGLAVMEVVVAFGEVLLDDEGEVTAFPGWVETVGSGRVIVGGLGVDEVVGSLELDDVVGGFEELVEVLGGLDELVEALLDDFVVLVVEWNDELLLVDCDDELELLAVEWMEELLVEWVVELVGGFELVDVVLGGWELLIVEWVEEGDRVIVAGGFEEDELDVVVTLTGLVVVVILILEVVVSHSGSFRSSNSPGSSIPLFSTRASSRRSSMLPSGPCCGTTAEEVKAIRANTVVTDRDNILVDWSEYDLKSRQVCLSICCGN
jgi:hypothetical protein